MRVKVICPVFPTEDEEKLKRALERFFGFEFQLREGRLIGEGEEMKWIEAMREQVKVKRIEPTAREVIVKGAHEGGIEFKLNKQALCIGKVNFVEEEHILGEVLVEVKDIGVDELVSKICE